MSRETSCGTSPEPGVSGLPSSSDPLADFLSSPGSHLADILYINFRIYKKKVLWRFFRKALTQTEHTGMEEFCITDVGASMGFDALYLIRMLTDNFCKPLPFERLRLSLIEGDPKLIERGERLLGLSILSKAVQFQFHRHPLVKGIPLGNQSQHLVICSEVVEHLEEPEKLFDEVFRVLKPGGFFLLTTDNSPSLFQHIRRIPAWLSGRYRRAYARPAKESITIGKTVFDGHEFPIYGHINLNPTRVWEQKTRQSGFQISSYGTYESIRRGGGSRTPLAVAFYFLAGAFVSILPVRIGRFFGDTTALLLQKKTHS